MSPRGVSQVPGASTPGPGLEPAFLDSEWSQGEEPTSRTSRGLPGGTGYCFLDSGAGNRTCQLHPVDRDVGPSPRLGPSVWRLTHHVTSSWPSKPPFPWPWSPETGCRQRAGSCAKLLCWHVLWKAFHSAPITHLVCSEPAVCFFPRLHQGKEQRNTDQSD